MRDVYTMPRAGQVWKHLKTGNLYLIDHVGLDAETGGPDVSYYRLDEFETYRLHGPSAVKWCHRALEDFLRSVRNASNEFEFRFVWVADGTEGLSAAQQPGV